MNIIIEEDGNSVHKETDSVCVNDVVMDIFHALLGVGYARENVLSAFQFVVDEFEFLNKREGSNDNT